MLKGENKTKSKQKVKLIIFVLGLMLAISVLNINKTAEQSQTEPEFKDITKEEDDITDENPSSSGVEYVGIDKTITKGSQGIGIEDNIKYDDNNIDATNFKRITRKVKTEAFSHAWPWDLWPLAHPQFFTTDDLYIIDALANDDNKYLGMDCQYASIGHVWSWNVLGFGTRVGAPFVNNPEKYRGVNQVQIKYEMVYTKREPNITPNADNIQIRFRAGNGLTSISSHDLGEGIMYQNGIWSDWVLVDDNPIHGERWTRTITIDGSQHSEILAAIWQGSYIDCMEVQVKNPEYPTVLRSRIRVDWVDIFYHYMEQQVDFQYELEIKECEIPDFQQFKSTATFTVDLEDSSPNVDLYLYDDSNSKWDKFGTTSSWDSEVIHFTVERHIENYFSNENKTRIRFYRPKFFRYTTLTRLWVDTIEIDFTTGIMFDIHSPENKTYYKDYFDSHMDGYYLSTNGFENDEPGTEPEWFKQVGTAGGTVEVIEELDQHKKVLELNDTSSLLQNAHVSKDFSTPQTNGTIEYWMQSDDVSKVNGFLVENGGNSLVRIRTWNNNLQVRNGSVWQDVVPLQNNTWYHIRVDFECTSGLYSGLSQYNWCIYVDGVKYGNYKFISNEVQADRIWWFTDYLNFMSGYIYYIDAIGVSWDSDYNIGENFNEGLLLSFTNYTNLDWMGFSLDNQDNKTILGDFTIPIPDIGTHTIQFFGNDSFGIMYHSEKRYFAVSSAIPNITIKTPEPIIYTEPMLGYYLATYGFENDVYWSEPEQWTSPAALSRGTVIRSLGNHEKVVEIDNIDWKYYYIINSFEGQENGTIEFWLRITDSGEVYQMGCLGPNGGPGPTFKIVNNKWRYSHSGATGTWSDINNLPAPLNNTWMHITLEFECGNGGYKGLAPDTYRIIMNENSSEDLPFRYETVNLTTFYVSTGIDFFHDNYRVYIDAVGYSWDVHYEIGDNKNEGLLLDFTLPIELDWIGYSLDGQPNRTILGDIVIPFLEDGNHSIQIFGRNPHNKIIKSPVRHFITDANAPSASISFNPYKGDKIVNQTTLFAINADDDAGSGIDTIKYKLNNTEWLDYKDPFDLNYYAPGLYNLLYYATDLAGHAGEVQNITIELLRVSIIDIDILDHMYSIEVFNITLFLCNEFGKGINSATIQSWWDGNQVSQSDITNLGGGLYVLSLTPITVAPGGDRILLNMTITAEDCFAKYYKTYLAVDPDSIDKGPPFSSSKGDDKDDNEKKGVDPTIPLIILGISIAGCCIVVIVAWKKELLKKFNRK